MRRHLTPLLFALVLLTLILAGCASGPPKRVYPPQARIQELVVLADGRANVKLRVQNFSNVPMQFSRVTAEFKLLDQPAAQLDLTLDLGIGPGSAEIVEHTVSLGSDAATRVSDSLRERRSLRYQITGRILSSEPRGDYPFEYQSALDPVPGLTGVLR